MAAIKETTFIIKLNELVREKSNTGDNSEFDTLSKTIEEIVQELVPKSIIVEVEKA
jgi:hypothetical protein